MKFNNITCALDLIWFDGPLLSYFVQDGKFYYIQWVDETADGHVWLIYEVAKGSHTSYLLGKMSLRAVIEAAPEIYIIDGDGPHVTGGDVPDLPLIKFADISEDRLPSHDSHYEGGPCHIKF